MDLRSFVDCFNQVACIMAIDRTEEFPKGRYTILEANDAYRRTVTEDPNDFTPNVPYTKYITKDMNFETMCLTCTKTQKPLHVYIDTPLYNAWMEVYLIPLTIDGRDDLCLFSYELNFKADADKMADISPFTAMHVLKTCIKLRQSDDFAAAMDSIIADIREICDANRCVVLLTDPKARKCSVLAEDYIIKSEPPMAHFIDDHFYSIVESWDGLIAGSNCFILTSDADMEYTESKSPEWAASLKKANVSKLVLYPLKNADRTIGYIWANNFDASRTNAIKEILEITTFILSAEIANHQMINEMHIMSTTDLLTGVLNRNAMNNRISANDTGASIIKAPYAFFFVDVNGLKVVNDSKGHLAGDELLKDVSSSLSGFFPDSEIYRVGGDEFLIISTDISRDIYEQMNRTLSDNAVREGRAHYAVGSCFSDDAKSIRNAMQIADKKMYEDKEKYYRSHPELKWDNRTGRNRG